MSAIEKIAFLQNRNDEIPNQKLAKELAETENIEGIREIAEHLRNKNKNIQNDCIKVLYEIGYMNPALIADYVSEFIKLLRSKNNRLVWGGMIALAVVADLKAEEIYSNIDEIYSAMAGGSVITIDNGVKVLAKVALCGEEYSEKIYPYLINHLRTCRAKEIPQHSESIVAAVNQLNKDLFIDVLKQREHLLTPAQFIRIKKIYKKIEAY